MQSPTNEPDATVRTEQNKQANNNNTFRNNRGNNRRRGARDSRKSRGGPQSLGRQFENLLSGLLRIDEKTGATGTVTFEAAVRRGKDMVITSGNFDCSLNPKSGFVLYETMDRREALRMLDSSMAVVVRVFHPELPRVFARKPIMRVYSFMVHPNTDVIVRLTPEENRQVQCMDMSTEQMLPPEEGVEYC